MDPRDPRRLVATAVWIVTMLLCIAAALLIVLTIDVAIPESWGFRGSQLLFAVVFVTVGAIVGRRRPGHRLGWLFLTVGVLAAAQGVITAYVETGVFGPFGRLPADAEIAWVLTWIWMPTVSLATIGLPMLFPDGQLPSARWRPIAGMIAVGIAIETLALSVTTGPIPQAVYLQNPLGLPGAAPTGAVFVVPFVAWPIGVVLAVASLVNRWRRSRGDSRQQLKWLALAGVVTLSTVVGYSAITISAGGPVESSAAVKAAEIASILGILAIPVAAGLAILRYRLFEIDRIVSRSVSYALVTSVLAAVFLATNLALQAGVSNATGGGTAVVAASTLLVAALFQPFRRMVQAPIDRRFNRARIDAERTVAAFAERTREEVDLDRLQGETRRAVAAAVQPTTAALWLRGGAR